MSRLLTTREVADVLGTETWRVQRLFEEGHLPEPPRFAGRRVITPDLIPSIVDAMRARGWLPTEAEASA